MILTRLFRALVRRPVAQPQSERLRELLARAGAGEALPHLRAAHAAAPLEGDLLEAYVRTLLDAGLRGEALEVAREASRTRPQSRESWFSLGLALQADHAYAEALESYDRALATGARDAHVYANRGIAQQNLGRLELAAADYGRALESSPDHPLARFHASLLALMRGRYAEGWPQYETRLASADLVVRPRRYPRWHGEDVRERTILVYGEQGLGDEIMFASCLSDLERAGARCVIECRPELRALFARSFPRMTVYAARPDKQVPDEIDALGIDYEVPLGSLPLHYRPTAADFSQHGGYLRAAPERVAAWRERLDALGPGLKVGVSWRGGTHASRAPLRSIALERWLPILEMPGAHFVSLQYTPDAAAAVDVLREERGIEIAHWPEAIADYDETAALVTALDLTISVCTSIVHLAGALGRPVWVMAPVNPEWRYGHAGEGMPWYPSARLFRQQQEGGWAGVIDAVARRLSTLRPADAGFTAPDAAQTHNSEGIAQLRAGDFRAAQRSFERALEAAPGLAEAHCNLGIALLEQGHEAQGERELREAIDLDPGWVGAWENLAAMLAARHDDDAAAGAWDRVLARDPRHANAHAGKAFLAFRDGRFAEARGFRDRALALGADATPLRMQEAAMLAMCGDTAGARRLLESLAPAADPQDLQWELALCELYDRRFENAWPLYEARLRKRSDASRRPYHYPEWHGERLHEGSLLILGEQGIGDEIMFASCYSDAIARTGSCVIECEPRLEALFSRSFPDARVVGQPRHGAHPDLVGHADIAAQVHCGSLPKFFRRHAGDFPRHEGYLVPDARRAREWRSRLADGRKRLAGIAWNGGLKHTRRSARSIAPEVFAQLLHIPDADFVSLQHDDDGAVAAELARRSGARVHVLPEAFADFDELAALVASLDCVVTVCSTIVHLAGALGARALVLVPRQPEWRYSLEGASMPWYPSVRLFRQRRSAEWAPVIENARAALADVLDSPRSDRS